MNERKRRIWVPPVWALLPVLAIVMAGISVAAVLVTNALTAETDSKNAVGAVAVEQAVTIETLCRAGGEVAAALESAGQCDKAQEVQDEVDRQGASPASVAVAPTIDRDELMRFVRTAVGEYCAGRNECTPDTALLISTVAEYLRLNPPAPGRGPTSAEVEAGARTVLTSDPDLFRGVPGVNGEDGERGPGPTDEQVAAGVLAFCGANDQCRGAQGPQGIGIPEFYFERNSEGVCEAVVTFHNPATDERVTERRQASDPACAPIDGGILPGG
jgi:hypothetical protein